MRTEPQPQPDPDAMIELRHPGQADIDAMLSIQHESYGPAFIEGANAFRSKLDACARTCWLALRNDRALAYLIALPVSEATFPALNQASFEANPGPTMLYLHDLAVAPIGRSLGLGRRLLERALASAPSLGLERVGLIAVQGSVAYWRRQGFALADAIDPALRAKVESFGPGAHFMERRVAVDA